jgi:hypothetical protein
MGLKFGTVLGASAVDDFLNGRNTQIIVDHSIGDHTVGRQLLLLVFLIDTAV